jgi:hypothetical protein
MKCVELNRAREPLRRVAYSAALSGFPRARLAAVVLLPWSSGRSHRDGRARPWRNGSDVVWIEDERGIRSGQCPVLTVRGSAKH